MGTYQIQGTAATPTFTPASGTSFPSTLSVSIADATPSASIYYTTDGSTPTTASQLYSGPFTISATTTVRAIATASGYTQSAQGLASYTYSPTQSITQTPTFSPAGGSFTSAQQVTISDATAGAVIYYTTNGTTPTTSSAVYSSAITVSASSTLEALAVAPGYTQSAVATAAFVIQSGGTSTINFGSGFPSATGLQLNSATKVNANSLEITTGGTLPGRERLLYHTGQYPVLYHQLYLPAGQRHCRRIYLHHPGCRARQRLADTGEALVMDRIRPLEQRAVSPRVSPSNSTSTATVAKAPIPRVCIPTEHLRRSQRST